MRSALPGCEAMPHRLHSLCLRRHMAPPRRQRQCRTGLIHFAIADKCHLLDVNRSTCSSISSARPEIPEPDPVASACMAFTILHKYMSRGSIRCTGKSRTVVVTNRCCHIVNQSEPSLHDPQFVAMEQNRSWCETSQRPLIKFQDGL